MCRCSLYTPHWKRFEFEMSEFRYSNRMNSCAHAERAEAPKNLRSKHIHTRTLFPVRKKHYIFCGRQHIICVVLVTYYAENFSSLPVHLRAPDCFSSSPAPGARSARVRRRQGEDVWENCVCMCAKRAATPRRSTNTNTRGRRRRCSIQSLLARACVRIHVDKFNKDKCIRKRIGV